MNYFSLTFNINNGGTKTVNIYDVDKTLTAGALNMAAGKMIAADIFDLGAGGSLANLNKARLVEQTRETLF